MVSVSTVGFAYLLTGTALLVLLREPLRHPGKPGSRGFAFAMIGVALWPLSLGVNYFVANLDASIALWNLRLLAAAVISASWFLLAIDFTSNGARSRRVGILLVAYLVVGQAIIWTNHWHHLVLLPGTGVQGTVFDPVNGPYFWIQAAINYGLIVAATGLLATQWLRSSGLRRTQAGVLALAVVPPIVANLITIFDVISTAHDLTPFGLIGSGLLLSWALYRVRFLDIVPIAREVAMANMRDAVVTLDSDDRVIDANQAAIERFDPPTNYLGRHATVFFDRIRDDVVQSFLATETDGIEFSTTLDDEEHHFYLSVSSVHDSIEAVGRVLVIHDITAIKHRERTLQAREAQLDLLQQVLSRILRHNLRNTLVTIRGQAAEIRRDGADEATTARSSAIVEASDSLLSISEKAREIERIVNQSEDPLRVDLRELAERIVEHYRSEYPDVTFHVEGASTWTVWTVPGFETALSYLVENAAEYNDAEDPTVTISITAASAGPRVSVVDNGPGIPAHELEVLRKNQETPLEHGSGIGLWIVKWAVDAAGARLTFDADETGTNVTITFDGAQQTTAWE